MARAKKPKATAIRMTPRQLKLGSLPRGLFSRWELRSDCGIRGAITIEKRGYHERLALQKKQGAGRTGTIELDCHFLEKVKRDKDLDRPLPLASGRPLPDRKRIPGVN